MIAFFDWAAHWALGFWRTVVDAQAFAKSRVHLDAIKEMHETNFEYMHYAGIWQPVEIEQRHAYCDHCGAETVMPAKVCSKCGISLADVFTLQFSG